MASRPFTPAPQRPRRHKRNPQWRRDRRSRPSMASLQAALAIIPSLPRPLLDRLTQRMIDRLDQIDEADGHEPNGDELDGTGGEDDFCRQHSWGFDGPGCPLSDPGEDDLEDSCSAADDGCAPLYRHGVLFWGSAQEEYG